MTANARGMGSSQMDALQKMTGFIDASLDFVYNGGVFSLGNRKPDKQAQTGTAVEGNHRFDFDSSRVARSSTETRPTSTAFVPRLCM